MKEKEFKELKIEEISMADFKRLAFLPRTTEYTKILDDFKNKKLKVAKITAKDKKNAKMIRQGIRRVVVRQKLDISAIVRDKYIIIFKEGLLKELRYDEK